MRRSSRFTPGRHPFDALQNLTHHTQAAMNRLFVLLRSIGVASALGLLWLPRAAAQAVAPVAAPSASEETVELSPFIVEAEADTGYAAKYTLAGTRIRTELKDLPSSISVVTKQFLQDTGGVNNET